MPCCVYLLCTGNLPSCKRVWCQGGSISAYFDNHSRGVSWLISPSLDGTCSLDFAGRFMSLMKLRSLLLVIWSVCNIFKTCSFSKWLEHCNCHEGATACTNNAYDIKHFRNFVTRLDLVDKFQNEHPKHVEWTWTDRGTSGRVQHSSCIDQVLVKRIDLDLLDCPSFFSIVYSEHQLIQICI